MSAPRTLPPPGLREELVALEIEQLSSFVDCLASEHHGRLHGLGRMNELGRRILHLAAAVLAEREGRQ